jgi:hypothetical protein
MDNHILTQKVDTFWLCCFEWFQQI